MTATGWVTAAALVISALPALAASSRVTFTADDGVGLVATVWDPAARSAPAVVLVHMPSRTRHDWDRLGEQLAARGFVALALDLRGHGESEGEAIPASLALAARDVAAALRYLLSRTDLQVGAIGLVGASAGATLGVMAASGVPAVRAFALLSAPLDFRGLRLEEPLRRVADRAVLAMASNEDAYAVRSARALMEIGPGRRELVLVDGAGHGARMLVSRPDLVGALVDWFERTLL